MSETSWDLDLGGGSSEKTEFTKFPEGITYIRILDDAPFIRWVHWMPKFSRSVNCPGKGCPICEIRKREKVNKMPVTYGMSKRFAINIINRTTGRHEVMEQGKTFFEDVKDMKLDLESKGLTIKDADLKVRRRGTGKDDTSYRIDLGEPEALSEDDLKMAENSKLLPEYLKPHTIEQVTRLINGEAWEEVFKRENSTPTDDEPVVVQ